MGEPIRECASAAPTGAGSFILPVVRPPPRRAPARVREPVDVTEFAVAEDDEAELEVDLEPEIETRIRVIPPVDSERPVRAVEGEAWDHEVRRIERDFDAVRVFLEQHTQARVDPFAETTSLKVPPPSSPCFSLPGIPRSVSSATPVAPPRANAARMAPTARIDTRRPDGRSQLRGSRVLSFITSCLVATTLGSAILLAATLAGDERVRAEAEPAIAVAGSIASDVGSAFRAAAQSFWGP